MNRVYNIFLVRNTKDFPSEPEFQLVMCKEHWKRCKRMLKTDSEAYAYQIFKGQKVEDQCYWCEDQESWEKIEARHWSKDPEVQELLKSELLEALFKKE